MSKEMKIVRIENWFPEPVERPVLICGPCSAESYQQVLDTAKELDKIGKIGFFRAGIWKPRTRPGSFEGVGEKGLEWLMEVKASTKMKVVTEVANPVHVERALKYGIDCVWIGARTVSNPFSVQEICDALKGSDIPVFVKNPVNPDLQLWIGAIERVYKAGINRICAIHRGFYPFEATSLRNIPKWEVAIDLKCAVPNISVICDPSHISGKRAYIPEVAQKALSMNMDGLMLECHIDPDSALSDSDQQLTPSELALLLNQLVFLKPDFLDKEILGLLEDYRNQIDSIDSQLIELLAQRMKIVEKIGKYKKDRKVTILQQRRWAQIIESRTEHAKHAGLSEEFIHGLLQLVHKESISKQEEIFKKKDELL